MFNIYAHARRRMMYVYAPHITWHIYCICNIVFSTVCRARARIFASSSHKMQPRRSLSLSRRYENAKRGRSLAARARLRCHPPQQKTNTAAHTAPREYVTARMCIVEILAAGPYREPWRISRTGARLIVSGVVCLVLHVACV